MKINKKIILLLVCVYYLIIALISLVLAIYGIYDKLISSSVRTYEIVLIIPLLLLSIIMITTNWKLLFAKTSKNFHKYLLLNEWVSFFQIIKFKLIGFFYFFSYGAEVILYYVNQDSAHNAGIKYNLFDLRFKISYLSKETTLLIGLNVVALLIFLILNRLTNLKDKNYLEKGVIYGLRKRNE